MAELTARTGSWDSDINHLEERLTKTDQSMSDLQAQLHKQAKAPVISQERLKDVQSQASIAHSMASDQQVALSETTKQLDLQKARQSELEQQLLDLITSSTASLAQGLEELQQGLTTKLASSAEVAVSGQVALQKDSVKLTQRLEGLAAQHAAFAERLIAAEAKNLGESSPRAVREATATGRAHNKAHIASNVFTFCSLVEVTDAVCIRLKQLRCRRFGLECH